MALKIFLLLLLILIPFSKAGVCQQKKTYAIKGRILSRQDNSTLAGTPGVKICIRRVRDGVIIGKGQSKPNGSYEVTYEETEMIDATFGNALFLPETVQSLSGEANHDLTKVLVKNGATENGQMVKLTSQQSHGVISAFTLIQSKPDIFEAELREAAMNLDETMFPVEAQEEVAQIRLTAVIQERNFAWMAPSTISGTIVSQSPQDLTVRKEDGALLRIHFLETALCGYMGTGLQKCGQNSNWVKADLKGRKVEIEAAFSSANAIAVADRIRVSPDQ